MLDAVELQSCVSPRNTLIVLHGLGADGEDFVPVCQALELSSVGGARFVLPHAPIIPVSINGGYAMRAWYDIRHTDLGREEDEAGLRRSQQAIDALIAQEVARGTAPERIVLMGFSQGCAMTLMTGLRNPHKLAALVGLSGYLPILNSTETERLTANQTTPIFLAHGRHDAIVPLARARDAEAELRRLGYTTQWQDYAMEHSVHPQEITDLQAFLLKVLA